jgi:energy-coupling factor transport system ATP-binding protein
VAPRRAPEQRPPAVRANGAGFTYEGSDRPAVLDVDIEVEPGSVLLVVGPSGSGKSTFARGVAGLLPWQLPGTWQGSLRIGDTEVARGSHSLATRDSVTTRGLDAGIVLQDPASQLVMERVGDDIAFGLENAAWPLAGMRAKVPEALAVVGLAGFEDRRSTRLSGGEQQRVAIAGVLAMEPGLLVLDEPTASLDPGGAETVAAVLRRVRDEGSTTIVLVEHRAALAWPLADVVVALGADGRPIDVGPPADVLARSGAVMADAGIWLPSDTAGARRRRSVDVGAKVLAVDGVTFAFERERPVLRDLRLNVRAGERVGLVGRNGSGKTTLLRLALGLLRPTAGRVTLGGRNPARLRGRELARLAGYVVQDPELGFLGDTVREEVELGLDGRQVAFAHELCDRLALPLARFGERSPYRLSGGEQRRLSLITGLARRPALLALDEPTYGQDRRGHEALVEALDELVGQDSAVLAATHDARFVADALDREVRLP